ncbi:MAG: fructosamine kinase family protein [Leptospiraceae bacterium]|nr:fructosamine kinase family protein [Leptospiraceae bacterium]
MHPQQSLEDLLRSHRAWQGFQLLGLEYVSRSLFTLYKAVVKDNEGHLRRWAVKQTASAHMAACEANGLRALRQLTRHIPTVHWPLADTDLEQSGSLLIMDYIARGRVTRSALMDCLRELYNSECNQEQGFGWSSSNMIGSLPQLNRWYDSFSAYWLDSRIEAQLRLARQSGQLSAAECRVVIGFTEQCIEAWDLDFHCRPHLIHGDLWSGNILTDEEGTIYLIDPAVSYGHPEQDLAMLQLFGAVVSCQDCDQLLMAIGARAGFAQRIGFWQLYPLLVHVNLFGSAYKSQLLSAIKSTPV